MKISAPELRSLTSRIFVAGGCGPEEGERIAAHLVEANLVGHDSHGVIRVRTYIEWLLDGQVMPNRTAEVIFENEAIAIVDGRSGFGQSIGEEAVQLGIRKCEKHGVSVVGLRKTGHLGRIGDWPEMAARAGKLSLHFVNTSGRGVLVAPFGGIDRRLSANPIAAGVPVDGRDPIILDISACMIAEGKIRVALNKGVTVPEGCLIDGQGNPCSDPATFYSDPGAILPFGGHKGYALGIIVEMLAGALTGGDCTNPENSRQLHNGMLSIYLDPAFFGDTAAMQQEISRFISYVKSARTVTPAGEILMPGDLEARNRAERQRHGIHLDDNTWAQILEAAASVGISAAVPPE